VLNVFFFHSVCEIAMHHVTLAKTRTFLRWCETPWVKVTEWDRVDLECVVL